MDAKDFDEAIYILLTRRLDRRRRIDGLRLIKTKLKFISKFKKDSLSWKQIEKIWAIGDDQEAHYNSFSDTRNRNIGATHYYQRTCAKSTRKTGSKVI